MRKVAESNLQTTRAMTLYIKHSLLTLLTKTDTQLTQYKY